MEQQELCCSSSSRQCRICHEEEGESCASMESPCACSGSLQYAHKGCVQRWCDEKGSNVCEICLQNFEPGYTIPPKKARAADVAVTIRGSLEAPMPNHETQIIPSIRFDGALTDLHYIECSRAASRSAYWCRSVAVTFTIVLLVRHLIAVVTSGAAYHYALSLLTIYLLRASGILLPFYVIMRLICMIQQGKSSISCSCSMSKEEEMHR